MYLCILPCVQLSSSSPGCRRTKGLAEKEDESWLDQHWHPAQGPNSFKQVYVAGIHCNIHLAIFEILKLFMPTQSKHNVQEFKASADLQITRDMYEDALRDLQEEQVLCYLIFSFSCPTWAVDVDIYISLFSLIAPLASHLCSIQFDRFSNFTFVHYPIWLSLKSPPCTRWSWGTGTTSESWPPPREAIKN